MTRVTRSRNVMIIAAALIILLVCQAAFAGTSSAESEIISSGTTGDCQWTLGADGVLTISGDGAMADYETASASPWYSDRQSIKKVVIEDGVTRIGARSFYNCSNLTEIEIGSAVTTIGSWAFYNLGSLKELEFPASVTTLENSSIRSCTVLSGIAFLGDAPLVGSNVFADCSFDLVISYHPGSSGWDAEPWTSYNLEEKHILKVESFITEPTCTEPGMAQYICVVCGETATEEAPALGHDYVDGVCSRCGDIEILASGTGWTLYRNGLLEVSVMPTYYSEGQIPWRDYRDKITEVVIEDGVTSIGNYAFYNCSSLTSITIPESVTSIGELTFYYCTSLTSITLPEGVTSIGDSAFYNCTSLESITIPDGVTIIGVSAFLDCTSLTSITIPESVTSIGYTAFFGCSSLESITIPESVTSIGYGTFENCSSLTSITIPDSVTSIGGSAFSNCQSLTSITLPDSVTSIDYQSFFNCTSLESITIPDRVTSIGNNAFNNCTSLESITIPESVTSIGGSAFSNCQSLTSITLPDSVTSIGNGTFENCQSLTSIAIPESVTSIGYNAFYNCSSLESITLPESVTDIGNGVFSNCTSLTSITIPEGVTSIGDSAFSNCTSLTSITIPEGVTSIGNYAFYNCSSLASITILEGVTSIGNYAFDCCTSLTSITIPEGVTSIGNYAFHNCSSLTSITIPEGVTSIDSQTFYNCSSLKSITIPESVTRIDSQAFYNCSSLESITIPERVTRIDPQTFYNCSSLKSITIPESVTSIEYQAFYNCSSLKSITIPESVTRIDSQAFYNCSSLERITIPEGVSSIGEDAFYGCTSLLELVLLTNSVSTQLPYPMYYVEEDQIIYFTHGSGKYLAYGVIDYLNVDPLWLPNLNQYYNVFVYGIDGDVVELPDCDDDSIVFFGWYTGDHETGELFSPGEKVPFEDLPWGLRWDGGEPEKYVALYGSWAYAYTEYRYTVNYYKDSISPDNLLGTDSGTAGIGTVIPYDNGKYLPHGYSRAVEIEEKTITRNEAENVLNIVYLPREVSETEICRIAGSNRYATSIEAAEHLKEKNGIEKFESIIIASGDDFPDALSASYLAYKKDGPILLVGKNSVALIADYVNANLASGGKVYIVGGTGAVPQAVDDRIKAVHGSEAIVRLAGSNRYTTNLKVLDEAGVEGQDILVASGNGFADALSASAAKRPILLVGTVLLQDQKDFLAGNSSSLSGDYYIIGGTGAVGQGIEDAIKGYGTVKRLAGSNRYDTSIKVAEQFFPWNAETIVIANAMDFPDGLSGGPIAAAYDAPLILVIDTFNGHAADLFAKKDAIRLVIMGGKGVIADATASKIVSGTV